MFNRFISWLLGYAGIVLLLGLGLLGMAAYTAYSASHGGKIPAEAALTVQSGHVTGAREVTQERKRRRGGKSTQKYYELDLQPKGGEVILLRMDYAVPREALETMLDEDVTIKYDPSDDNTAYVIQFNGQDLVTYAQMAQLSQQRADSDKEFFAAPGTIGFALLLALLGGGGLVWRRKLQAAEKQENAQENGSTAAQQQPAGGSMIGSNIQPNQFPTSGESK